MQENGLHDAFVAFADDNAILIRGTELIKGKNAIDAHYKNQHTKDLTWKVDFVEISKSGDLGYTYGEYIYSYQDSIGNQQKETGVFNTQDAFFAIPEDVLRKGRDYYISVAVGDNGVFGDFSTLHLRTAGSYWEETVSNATGWTIETTMKVVSTVIAEDSSSSSSSSSRRVISITIKTSII